MANVDDYKAFGDLLSKRKSETGQSFSELKRKLGADPSPWHPTLYRLPKAKKLPAIAEAYGISLEELTVAYEQARNFNRASLSARRGNGGKKTDSTEENSSEKVHDWQISSLRGSLSSGRRHYR